MKVGDLVRRIYRTEGQKLRLLQFNGRVDDIGIIVEINQEKDMCVVKFDDNPGRCILPMSTIYLEVLSES
jgi:hypothetical protein